MEQVWKTESVSSRSKIPIGIKKESFPTMCSASIHVWFRNMDSNEKMAKKLNAAHTTKWNAKC